MSRSFDLGPAEAEQHLQRIIQRNSLRAVDTSPPREHRVEGPNVQVRVLDWEGTGTPLVFLHGGALTAHTWDGVCLALRGTYRCVAVDMRGHGDSGWSPDAAYDYGDYADDVRRVIGALGLVRPVLIGQSLGGFVTMHIAASGEPPLGAAVIVDAGPNIREAGRQRILGFLGEQAEPGTFDEFYERAMRFSPNRDPELLRTSLRQSLRAAPGGRVAWKWDPAQFASSRRSARDERRRALSALLPRIVCPALIVRGGRSDLFHDEDARQLAASIGNGRMVTIADAGHTVQGDQPRLLAEAIDAFVREINGQAHG
jgi:pimeloyl-ACP methyl ester carboxylesterase